MQVTVSRISQVVLELQIDVPADTVKAEVERVYSSLSKKAHVKGFRPGKAPRPVLKTLFGAQVENDVAQNLVNTTLPQALSSQNVNPVSQPTVVDASKVASDSPFTFKARMEVQPELAEVKFEGFELFRPKVEVADSAVDEQIEADAPPVTVTAPPAPVPLPTPPVMPAAPPVPFTLSAAPPV